MGIAAGILLLASLTACQGGSGSVAESCWKKAKKADSLEDYMAENEDKVDLEALKQEDSSPWMRTRFACAAGRLGKISEFCIPAAF